MYFYYKLNKNTFYLKRKNQRQFPNERKEKQTNDKCEIYSRYFAIGRSLQCLFYFTPLLSNNLNMFHLVD